MRRFTSPRRAQRSLAAVAYRQARHERIAIWRAVTGRPTAA